MSNRVSESEQIVMEVLWQESPLTSQQVVARLEAQDWNEKTVKTFLNRMVKKGVIGFEKEGRKYLYHPIIKREEYIQSESNGFLNKVFNGNVKDLLATFVQNKQLSKQEIAYLKELLEKE